MAHNKKKIGLVIRFAKNHTNYGSSLVNYAMLKLIKNLGYDCEVIHYEKKNPLCKKLSMLMQMFRIKAYDDQIRDFKAKISLWFHKKHAKNLALRVKAVNQFKQEKIEPSVRIYTGYDNLSKGALNYNAVVVGSDQLWTPMSLYNKYFNALFVPDSVQKISYGTSFGVSKLHKLQVKPFGEFLDRFSSISVREIQGKKIVETVSHKTAQVVCDPTLMFSREEWEKETASSTIDTTEPFIFCYLLGKNSQSRTAVNELKKKTGLKIIAIRHMDEYIPSDEQFGDEAPYNVSPLDFIKYISEAAYVCTDSFHATIFSIIFHKQFLTFYRYSSQLKESRNSRIDSLCHLLGLESRIYKNKIENIQENIDYINVDSKIEALRKESMNYLEKALA